MLTPNQVVDYIKTSLGFPLAPLEYSDQDILKVVRMESLKTFSRLVPDVKELVLDINDDNVKTGKINEFRIIDPDGCPILGIVNLYPTSAGLVISGHPVVGLVGGGLDDVANYLLQVESATTAYRYSVLNEDYEFIPPNIIRIMPYPTSNRLVVYEREHKPDFSTIPFEYEIDFLRLSYCDIAIWIARTRSYMRSISTPFGDIELNADDLKSDAKEERDRIIENLVNYNVAVIIDSG